MSTPTEKITGNGRNPVSEEDAFAALAAGRRNRGGRPRKDGSRADTSATLAEAGFSKRTAARMRAMARLTHEEFENACLMTFRAGKARRTAERGWLPSRQRTRVGSGVR